MKFIEKYRKICLKNNSLLCVGLDSDLSKIPSFLKEKSENPLWEFNKRIIDATYKYVAVYKPNFAFYISQGEQGIIALEKTLSYIPEEIPIILDVKIGDIGNTMKHYAKAYFGKYNVDAITANPLMGFDVIDPLLEFPDRYIFLLVLTSNKSNKDFLNDEQEMYVKICKKIMGWSTSNIGAVVGATNIDKIQEIRNLLPDSVFLIPGIGAQGGDLENVMKYAVSQNEPNILINSSRGIIFAGTDDAPENFPKAAGIAAKELQKSINSYL
ncbi:MAG: orotidine-5'-phosphate decarboxylase [Candidatus Cloacimonetes bacterium]|nr:orotidine-5'-phosphate decarboxylase [Candidatus Cloacimonadota bacterium]